MSLLRARSRMPYADTPAPHGPPRSPGRRGVVGVLLFASGCAGERVTEPGTSRLDQEASTATCGSECLLVADLGPIHAARAHPDSATPLFLAVVEVSGRRGDRVMLRLRAESGVLNALGRETHTLAEIGGTRNAFSSAELQHGVVVYTFERDGHVNIRYALERRVSRPVAPGAVQLVQRLTGAARVVAAQRRWVRDGPNFAAASNAALAPTGPCAVTANPTVACDNTVSFDNFVATPVFGGTFSSQQGSGASITITAMFAKPVRSVTVRIYDADYSGNQVVAYDAAGVPVGSTSFSFDNQPGNDLVKETKTVTTSGAGIVQVKLIPAPADFVAYDMSWEPQPPCVTGDPVIDDPVNREKFDSSFQASNSNAPQGSRQERYRAGYRLADGSVINIDVTPPGSIDCRTPDFNPEALGGPGSELLWIEHSHPYGVEPLPEVVTRCGNVDYDPPRKYDPGPSSRDWTVLDNLNGLRIANGKQPINMYIYDKHRVYRMNPNPTGQSLKRFDTFDRSGKRCAAFRRGGI